MSKYIAKYPWLRLMNMYTGKIDTQDDAMDDMPEGWCIAFGDMFCEEMDAAIKKAGLVDDFIVLQVKEKFGSLCFYHQPTTPEISDIVRKYEALSSHVCITCGKPDVPMLTKAGWIRPQCGDCYLKHAKPEYQRNSKSYEELASKETAMPNKITYRQYHKDGFADIDQDISETADKIRENWNRRQQQQLEDSKQLNAESGANE